jgi:pyrimidine-specific ribonucleoside hydrolase
MRSILVFLFTLLLLQPAESHYKARYHVIVDTDGSIDDFRAICMMLASPEIEVIAITTVDGILSPEQTAGKVRSLLKHFGHDGIPVGIGKSIRSKTGIPKKTATMLSSLQWVKEDASIPSGSEPDYRSGTLPGSLSGAVGLILENIELEDMPVDIIALGPLTNLATVLGENPGVADLVRNVYWYNDAEDTKDFNYAFDKSSAMTVLGSGFSIDRVRAAGNRLEQPDQFLAGLDTITTRYAWAVRDLYANAPPGFADHEMATLLADDCIPIYMLYPEKFTVITTGEKSLRRIVKANADADLAPLLLGVLDSDREDKSIIFSSFPVDPGLFEDDVAHIAPTIIERHGLKEWKIVVLTNEFHEHLGIYSILGAKMGLRAREYFHVGIDELEIVSYAGSTPPVSCLNDGLQVSTGGTLGHGTITLGDGQVIPKARFAFKNRIIELSVSETLRQEIKKDVGYGVMTYGLESPEYWDYIRELALRYWLELSRFDIFEIREITVLP